VRPVVALAGLSGLCATRVACGGSPPPPPVAAAPKPVAAAPAAPAGAAAAPKTVAAATPAPSAVTPAPLVPVPAVPQATGVSYDPKGRRDPFLPPDLTGGAKGLEVATTKLTGIVRSARTTLALVETQDGIGYILKPGDTLGDGRLTEIGADSVVFAIAAKPGSPTNRVVLKLAAN
jgi:hypothetical protein